MSPLAVSLIWAHIFALAVLLLIIWSMRQMEPDFSASGRSFLALIVVTAGLLSVDILNVLLEFHPWFGSAGFVVFHAAEICSFFFCELAEMLWLSYALFRSYKVHNDSLRAQLRLAFIPLAIATIIAVLSPWFGFFYQINPVTWEGTRGPLYFLQGIFGLVYFVWSLIVIFRGRAHARTSLERRDFTYLALFAVPAVLGGMSQVFLSDQELFWEFVTVSILFIYLADQNRRISTDRLTGCNNRRQFERYLCELAKRLDPDERLSVLFIDIDHFKSINDRFGHTEGDDALIYVTRILRSACKGVDCCIARVGGDEFAIAGFLSESTAAHELKGAIEVRAREASEKLPYELELSVGKYSVAARNFNYDRAMKSADSAMYKTKREHHNSAKNV